MSKVKDFIATHLLRRSNMLPPETRKQFTPDQQVEMEMTGSDGGVFTLFWESGDLKMNDGKAKTPVIKVKTSAKGFLDLMTGKYSEFVDFTKLDEGSQFMIDPLTLYSPKKLELVKKLRGTLVIKYCDGSAPTEDDILSETYMSFNGEPIDDEDPRCTVLMPVGKLERIAKGEVTPPQLMMAGGMRVIGDMQMVIQMSPLLR